MSDDASDRLDRLITEDADRLRKMLAVMLDVLGLRQRAIERRLALPRGYVSNVLTGRVELKQGHVTGILLAAGLHPASFYELAYPKDRPLGHVVFSDDFARRLSALGASPPPPGPPPAPEPPPAAQLPRTLEELHQLVDSMIQKALAAEGEPKPKPPGPRPRPRGTRARKRPVKR